MDVINTEYCYCARNDEIISGRQFSGCTKCGYQMCQTNSMVSCATLTEHNNDMRKLVQHKLREKKLKRVLNG